MDEGKSSYQFKPKAPENWFVKTRSRKDIVVRLITLKAWQMNAYMTLKDSPFGFLRAFCGSGKTILARAIGVYKIATTGKRQVFCVPRNDIGNDGFANYFDIELPVKGRKKVFSLDAPCNFCSPRPSKIDELIRILCRKPILDDLAGINRIVSSMQIVVTHQCLTLAIRKIKDDPAMLAKFIKNNTFWIDEGHHIKGHDESDEEKVTMNLLGKFVNHVLENKKHGVELFAMTATPYRGDYSKLFSPKQLEDFTTYSLDFLEHFPTLGIERVDMELEEYNDVQDVARRVARNIGKESDKHHIVFVPSTGHKWRRKKDDYKIVLDEIYRTLMAKTGCDLETAKSDVMDLVTENTQAANQKLLRQEPKSGDPHPPRFKVIVACMLCREGSDWCPAERIHNTSMEDSPPVIFQTNGRLFRHFPGKKHVKIMYYIERFKTILVGKREFVSDRVNAVLHYMLMDEMLRPIMVNIPQFIPHNKKKKGKEAKSKRNYSTLEQIFSHNYQDMKKFLLTSMAETEFNEDSVDQAISLAMQEYLPSNRKFTKGQKTQIRLGLKAFLLRSRSDKLRTMGVDISFIRKNGFDSIVEQNKISGIMYANKLTFKELKLFRQTVRKAHFTEEQKKKIVEGIYPIVDKQHPGMKRTHQDYLDSLHRTLKDEFCPIHQAYNQASATDDFTPENVAKIVRKPIEHVRKMISMFNRFCLPKEIKFNFRKDSNLARIIEKVA
jgi:hypothetical protein